MSDVYDKGQDTLEQIAGNIIDVETAIDKTNETLDKILEALQGGTKPKPIMNIDLAGDSLDSLNKQLQLKQRVEQLEAEAKGLRERSMLDDARIESLLAVYRVIPECNVHGFDCIPNAVDWVKSKRNS
jgi:predicted  nucleic acid-binding Zn-ribbon protein